MNEYYTLFDPIEFDRRSILELCDGYEIHNTWDQVYPGVNLKSKRGHESFNDFLGVKQIIDSFCDELKITYKQAQILSFDPGDKGVLHKDTDRQCGVLFPITPIGETFSPIEFFDEDKQKVASENYSKQAIIINVLKYHNVEKTNVRRINFQIDFDIPYAEVVELYNSGNLFK